MTELRKLNLSEIKYFDCDGRKYFIKDTLSFNRYKELQKLLLEFAYSASFISIYENIGKAQEAFNKHNYFDMAIILYNIQLGIVNLDSKDDPALRMCALFIDEENEDPTEFNDAKMKAKIDSWAKELDVSPFFHLAVTLTSGWLPSYEKITQNGLNQPDKQ